MVETFNIHVHKFQLTLLSLQDLINRPADDLCTFDTTPPVMCRVSQPDYITTELLFWVRRLSAPLCLGDELKTCLLVAHPDYRSLFSDTFIEKDLSQSDMLHWVFVTSFNTHVHILFTDNYPVDRGMDLIVANHDFISALSDDDLRFVGYGN